MLKKVDAKTNKLLGGATFALYDSTDKQIATAISDVNGLAQFTKIPHGKYSIKELKAPNGYAVTGKLVQVEITETYQNLKDPITVENSPLAQTGVDGFPWWGVMLLSACLLGCGAGGFMLYRRNKVVGTRRKYLCSGAVAA